MAEESLAEILERSTRRCRDADAPLAERLRLFADDVRSLSPDFAEVVERMIGRLQSSGAGLGAPAIGDPMPPFLLPNQAGELVSLEELLARGPLVVAFHRGHWCPYCRLNMVGLAEVEEAAKFADDSPEPDPQQLFEFSYATPVPNQPTALPGQHPWA
jgi:hypothetical protein